jgi:mono/diheme cytochrome c family protein
MKLLWGLVAVVAIAVLGGWLLTEPAAFALIRGETPAVAPAQANLDNGRLLFAVGGCASCHMVPGQDDRTRLGGGVVLKTGFGTFHPPNISPDPKDGIGGWTLADFVRAMRDGVSPQGHHYYPAFPYTSYRNMSDTDLADLFAYLKTLPAVQGRQPAHELSFPYSVRRGIGLWKLAFLHGGPMAPDPGKGEDWNRGRYLVEGPGHCAECHSPRDAAGAIVADKRFGGGPDAEGKGWVPNITSDSTGIASWSEKDISELLKTGFTPDFDSVGGSMTDVVRNTSQLSDADRHAMAVYIKSLPHVANRPPMKSTTSPGS